MMAISSNFRRTLVQSVWDEEDTIEGWEDIAARAGFSDRKCRTLALRLDEYRLPVTYRGRTPRISERALKAWADKLLREHNGRIPPEAERTADGSLPIEE